MLLFLHGAFVFAQFLSRAHPKRSQQARDDEQGEEKEGHAVPEESGRGMALVLTFSGGKHGLALDLRILEEISKAAHGFASR